MPESVKLIFPPISVRIVDADSGKSIWDRLRQRWLVLTPEEWVRQHAIAWLINKYAIPELRICQEYPVNINGQAQRADIVVLDEKARPYILVECKAADVAINDEVLSQALRYNAVVRARYVMLTNGKHIFCYEYSDGRYRPVKSIG